MHSCSLHAVYSSMHLEGLALFWHAFLQWALHPFLCVFGVVVVMRKHVFFTLFIVLQGQDACIFTCSCASGEQDVYIFAVFTFWGGVGCMHF